MKYVPSHITPRVSELFLTLAVDDLMKNVFIGLEERPVIFNGSRKIWLGKSLLAHVLFYNKDESLKHLENNMHLHLHLCIQYTGMSYSWQPKQAHDIIVVHHKTIFSSNMSSVEVNTVKLWMKQSVSGMKESESHMMATLFSQWVMKYSDVSRDAGKDHRWNEKVWNRFIYIRDESIEIMDSLGWFDFREKFTAEDTALLKVFGWIAFPLVVLFRHYRWF